MPPEHKPLGALRQTGSYAMSFQMIHSSNTYTGIRRARPMRMDGISSRISNAYSVLRLIASASAAS